jgi:TRAP transporter TAXI family solute receptor
MMKKIRLGLYALILATSFVSGLASEVVPQITAQSPSPTPSAPSKLRERLIWSSPKPGEAPYEQSLAVINLLSRHLDLIITLHPYPNLDAAVVGVHKKKVDLSIPTSSLAYHIARGIASDLQRVGIEEACPEFRMLMGGNVLWWSWITLPGSGIKTIADLKGKRVNYLTPGYGLKNAIGEDTLRAVGIDPVKDVKHIVFDDPNVAKEGLQHKKIDALLSALSGTKIVEVKSLAGLEVLPIPPEIYNTFRPALKKVTISNEVPAKYLAVVDKPTLIVGHQMLLVSRDDLHEQVAYSMVKTVMENARELDKVGPVFKEWGVKEYALPAQLVIPVHPGAIKYFKEAGMWSPAHEAQQQQVLAELKRLSK